MDLVFFSFFFFFNQAENREEFKRVRAWEEHWKWIVRSKRDGIMEILRFFGYFCPRDVRYTIFIRYCVIRCFFPSNVRVTRDRVFKLSSPFIRRSPVNFLKYSSSRERIRTLAKMKLDNVKIRRPKSDTIREYWNTMKQKKFFYSWNIFPTNAWKSAVRWPIVLVEFQINLKNKNATIYTINYYILYGWLLYITLACATRPMFNACFTRTCIMHDTGYIAVIKVFFHGVRIFSWAIVRWYQRDSIRYRVIYADATQYLGSH